jgi:ATP-dependent RNA helicase DeaD
VVETLGADHDLFDIAAAAVKLAEETRDGAAPQPQEIPSIVLPSSRPERPHRDRPAKPGPRERSKAARAKPSKPEGRGGKYEAYGTRLHIALGRDRGVRPADIVGAIANEAGVSPRDIGAINIGDKYSIVEVRESDAETIITALGNTKLRGQRVRVRAERANAGKPTRPKR